MLSLGCSEAGLAHLISCMVGGRFNEEARCPGPLMLVASASLRSGERGLPAQHLLTGLRYTLLKLKVVSVNICLSLLTMNKHGNKCISNFS